MQVGSSCGEVEWALGASGEQLPPLDRLVEGALSHRNSTPREFHALRYCGVDDISTASPGKTKRSYSGRFNITVKRQKQKQKSVPCRLPLFFGLHLRGVPDRVYRCRSKPLNHAPVPSTSPPRGASVPGSALGLLAPPPAVPPTKNRPPRLGGTCLSVLPSFPAVPAWRWCRRCRRPPSQTGVPANGSVFSAAARGRKKGWELSTRQGAYRKNEQDAIYLLE